ncbi:MAG TPA: hypothetical protein VHB79_17355 [Polyangiaceae bacterium]|nr:hypothetical protein [Polyangiaceae bacterium]
MPRAVPAERWLGAEQIADRLSISRSAAHGIMRKLPRLKVNRIVRVKERDLQALLTRHVQHPAHYTPLAALRPEDAGAAAQRLKPTRPRVTLPQPVSPVAVPPIRLTRPRVRKPILLG